MTKRNRKIQDKNTMRDALTNKRIGNKEVVCVDNAIDWVKKQGFLVEKPKLIKNTMYAMLCFLMFLLAISVTSALTLVPEYNSNQYPNLVVYNGATKIVNMSLVENKREITQGYAVINITNYIAGALPNSFDFKDQKGSSKGFSFTTYFYNRSLITTNIPYTNTSCITNTSNSTICINKILNYSMTSVVGWQLYSGQTFPVGNHSIKLVAELGTNFTPMDWGFSFGNITGDDIRNYWAWFNSSWAYRKNINISGGVGTLTNFTVWINVSYVNLKMNTDFSDIRFTNASCGSDTGYLSYENDSFVSGVVGNFWVKIPTLNTGNSNQICMYYGNPTATSTSDGVNAWDSNYTLIVHFSEGTGTTLKNSKDNNLSFFAISGSPNWVYGQYGLALNLSAQGGDKFATSSNALPLTDKFTAEVVDYSLFAGDKTQFAKAYNPQVNNYGFSIGQGSGTQAYTRCGNFNNAWNAQQTISDSVGSWAYLQCYSTNGATDSSNGFTNKNTGGSKGGGGGTGGTVFQGTWYIGRWGSAYPSNSTVDEVRYSNIIRSSEWLNRSVDNTNSTSFIFGSEDILVTVYPSFANETNNNASTDLTARFNITVFNTNGSVGISFNWTNYTMRNNSNVYSVNFSNLSFGNYTYYFWAYGNSSSNPFNQTNSKIITILPLVIVNNTNSNVTSNLFTYDFSTTSNVLFFIFLIVIAIASFMFVSHVFGVIFLFVLGIVTLLNYPNKLVGAFIMIGAILLTFIKER